MCRRSRQFKFVRFADTIQLFVFSFQFSVFRKREVSPHKSFYFFLKTEF